MDALQQPQVFVIQAEGITPRVKRVDSLEQGGVHVDRVLVGGQPGCHIAFHGLQGGAGIAHRQVAEQQSDPVEKAPAAI